MLVCGSCPAFVSCAQFFGGGTEEKICVRSCRLGTIETPIGV